jgi:hypothetical protein
MEQIMRKIVLSIISSGTMVSTSCKAEKAQVTNTTEDLKTSIIK